MQWRRDTNLGEERLITTSPENALATRIAGNSSAIAEKLAHILGLPYGRIDVATTDYPGQLIIGIRTVDLSVRDAAYHPMTTPWPDAEPSPFADWFPETASIRDPVIWGFCPEDGSALTLTLFSADRRPGGRGDRHDAAAANPTCSTTPASSSPDAPTRGWCSSTARTWAMS